MRLEPVVALILIALGPWQVAAQPNVRECLDKQRYPTVEARADCLENTKDAAAIPELHKMAQEIAAAIRNSDLEDKDFRYVARQAGSIATTADYRYLLKVARSKRVPDQAFALMALNRAELYMASGDPRRTAIQDDMRPLCKALQRSQNAAVRGEANLCDNATRKMGNLSGFTVDGEPSENMRLMNEIQLPQKDSSEPVGGLGLTGEGKSMYWCRLGVFGGRLDLCLNEWTVQASGLRAKFTIYEYLGPEKTRDPHWTRRHFIEKDYRSVAATTIDLLDEEQFPSDTPEVIARDGSKWLVFVPLIQLRVPSHRASARVVMWAYDGASQQFSTLWTSPVNDAGCKESHAELRGPDSHKELRVRLCGQVYRLRWSGGALTPLPE